MAVTVELPPHTDHVDDVVAVGVAAGDATARPCSAALIEAHRLSDGAAFLAPGTPTNNLADSASGYSITAVPPPGAGDRAGGGVGGGGARGRLEPRPAGPRPARRRRRPGARRGPPHEPRAVRGDVGLLPAPAGAARLRPESAAAGVRPRDRPSSAAADRSRRSGSAASPTRSRPSWRRVPWAPLAESAFESLARAASCRASGRSGPSGVVDAADRARPVRATSRCRATCACGRPNPSAAVDFMVAMGYAVVHGNPESPRRAMLAEVGFADAMPAVLTQLYPKGAADLWLPMAADGDTAFNVLAAAPKDATSVLGLLLRNSALRHRRRRDQRVRRARRGQDRRRGRAAAPDAADREPPRRRGQRDRDLPALHRRRRRSTTPQTAGRRTGQGRRAATSFIDPRPVGRHRRRRRQVTCPTTRATSTATRSRRSATRSRRWRASRPTAGQS